MAVLTLLRQSLPQLQKPHPIHKSLSLQMRHCRIVETYIVPLHLGFWVSIASSLCGVSMLS